MNIDTRRDRGLYLQMISFFQRERERERERETDSESVSECACRVLRHTQCECECEHLSRFVCVCEHVSSIPGNPAKRHGAAEALAWVEGWGVGFNEVKIDHSRPLVHPEVPKRPK